MGATVSTAKEAGKARRLSRASATSSTGAVDAQLSAPPPPPAQADRELDLAEFDDEAFDLPTFATRRAPRRHSAPVDEYTSSLDRRDDDVDTLCDSASIMTSFTDTTLSADPIVAYAAGSSVVSSAVEAAMDVLNGNAKGWRRDVALAQLEWLAADGARRARWVRSEAAARARRAAKGRRASLGAPMKKKSKEDMKLSVAGEERVVAEDGATGRRVGMEARAGEVRAEKEEEAKRELQRAHQEAPHVHPTHGEGEAAAASQAQPNGANRVNPDAAEAFKTERAHLRHAEEIYHTTCAAAADEHSAALAHAALFHERAFSASKVTYMGARLRDPDLQGELTFTAAAGGSVGVARQRGAFSGQYKVGRWGG